MFWAGIAAAVLLIGFLWWRRVRRPDGPPAVAMLLSSPMILTVEQIRRALEPEFGDIEHRKGSEVAEAPAFVHEFLIDGRVISIAGHPAPPENIRQKFSKDISELRTKEAVLTHGGLLTVELLCEGKTHLDEADLDLMGRVLGLIADERAMAMYIYPGMRTVVVTSDTLDHLRRGELADAFQSGMIAVEGVADGDQEMELAIQEARLRWPEFMDAYQNPQPGDSFSVKGRFCHEDDVEHMWLTPQSIDGSAIKGVLDNSPMYMPFLKLGSVVEIDSQDVSDWIIYRGEDTIGGFSIAVLMKRQGIS